MPNPRELGLMALTIFYFSFTFIAAFFSILIHLKSLINNPRKKIDANIHYLLSIFFLIVINYVISNLNSVPSDIWIRRSIHLLMIPIFYSIFTYGKGSVDSLFKCVYYVGIVEALAILFAFGLYFDTSNIRRATDIEGVVIYSVWIVFSVFYSLQQHRLTKQKKYLFISFIIIIAVVLTESRVLLVSTIILLLDRIKHRGKVVYIILGILLFIPLNEYGFFNRFDIGTERNMITVYAKMYEIKYLLKYFLTSPVFGVGFGRPYDIIIANSVYTYSHNMFLFYLAYGGVVGLIIGIYPIIKLLRTPGHAWLVISLAVYYCSSTSYTNVKHSILMALILVLVRREKLIVPRGNGISADNGWDSGAPRKELLPQQ